MRKTEYRVTKKRSRVTFIFLEKSDGEKIAITCDRKDRKHLIRAYHTNFLKQILKIWYAVPPSTKTCLVTIDVDHPSTKTCRRRECFDQNFSTSTVLRPTFVDVDRIYRSTEISVSPVAQKHPRLLLIGGS